MHISILPLWIFWSRILVLVCSSWVQITFQVYDPLRDWVSAVSAAILGTFGNQTANFTTLWAPTPLLHWGKSKPSQKNHGSAHGNPGNHPKMRPQNGRQRKVAQAMEMKTCPLNCNIFAGFRRGVGTVESWDVWNNSPEGTDVVSRKGEYPKDYCKEI